MASNGQWSYQVQRIAFQQQRGAKYSGLFASGLLEALLVDGQLSCKKGQEWVQSGFLWGLLEAILVAGQGSFPSKCKQPMVDQHDAPDQVTTHIHTGPVAVGCILN